MMDTKIKSGIGLRGRTTIPFIGDLPTSDTPSQIMQAESREFCRSVANHKDQSGVYVKQSTESMAKTIFLTSTFQKGARPLLPQILPPLLRYLVSAFDRMDIRNPRLNNI
jgi:hypothetical protein